MSIKALANLWSFPDRSMDRAQITLRLSYNDYARLHALKEIFAGRSVNDMLNDLIRVGLDELVESLEVNVQTRSGYEHDLMEGIPEEYIVPVGDKYGRLIDFERAYRRLLNERALQNPEQHSSEESKVSA